MATAIKNQAQTRKVTLPVPMEKDGNTVSEVEISKPHSGQLRGLSLIDVCEMKFEAGETLLPRISCLNERDLLNMPPENWAPLLTTIASFFVDMEH
ncbi:phage tail assembly protein [Vibrio sp. JC009]|uniref:phage tail assembly protein n=1 Tax=Vibrio sp. JC009 TaxID=2912314 RepID=UPI0023B1796F|nr:phage tail assembly protein [Vibrio sp. JC009]WED23523.1 phage tail assembly protein [Vibrio sp. JC009]